MKKNTRLLNMIILIATIVLAVVALATIALNLADMSLEIHGGAKGDLPDAFRSEYQNSFTGLDIAFGSTKSTPKYQNVTNVGSTFVLVPYMLLVLGIICATLGFLVKKLHNRVWVALTASILVLAAGFFLVIIPSIRFNPSSINKIEEVNKATFAEYVAGGYDVKVNVSYNLAPTIALYVGGFAALLSALVATTKLVVFNIEDKQAKEEETAE